MPAGVGAVALALVRRDAAAADVARGHGPATRRQHEPERAPELEPRRPSTGLLATVTVTSCAERPVPAR